MRDKQNFIISQEQEQEIKDHSYEDLKDLVNWSYYYESKNCNHLFQGVITLKSRLADAGTS